MKAERIKVVDNAIESLRREMPDQAGAREEVEKALKSLRLYRREGLREDLMSAYYCVSSEREWGDDEDAYCSTMHWLDSLIENADGEDLRAFELWEADEEGSRVIITARTVDEAAGKYWDGGSWSKPEDGAREIKIAYDDELVDTLKFLAEPPEPECSIGGKDGHEWRTPEGMREIHYDSIYLRWRDEACGLCGAGKRTEHETNGPVTVQYMEKYQPMHGFIGARWGKRKD